MVKAPGFFKDGEHGPGISCRSCGHMMAVVFRDPMNPPSTWPAKCPKCGHQSTYRQDEIQILTARQKH